MEPRTHARGNNIAGHDLTAREVASMEPRTHARGNISEYLRKEKDDYRFNGATHSRAWKHMWHVSIDPIPVLASMEPRTHARGNVAVIDVNEAIKAVLQWSHALTRVETGKRECDCPRFRAASMEPRTHARGNLSLSALARTTAIGFNGATHSRAWKPRDRSYPRRV